MQDMDIRTVLTIISVVITLVGMFIAWMFEIRKNRYTKAVDATGNKLLPFYSAILELIVKYNLFIMSLGKVSYGELKISPSKLYDRAGNAFVYIRENSSRQFTMNIIQIIETIDIMAKKKDSYEFLSNSIIKLFPYLIKLKDTIEQYITTYSKIMNVPRPDMQLIQEIGKINVDDLLVNILENAISNDNEK